MSQTPSFDKAINEILAGLKPHQKTCPQCLSRRSAEGAKADGAVFDIVKIIKNGIMVVLCPANHGFN